MNDQQKPATDDLVEDLLWRFAEAEFDERAGVLKLSGVEIELEPRPLEVLAYLLRHAGEVVTKEELLEAIWHRKPELISDKVLTNAIGKLRRELKDEQEAIITTLPRRGYRLSVPVSRVVVGRRAVPKLDFKPGEKVPRREQWRLLSALDVSQRSEVWLAEHEKTHARRVFKFSADGARLSALKREVTLSRVLVQSLGERADFIPVLEWNFEEAPYFIECDYGGDNWLQWAEAQGGLAAVPLATRLDLFAQAAEAIGAAHGVGVLHKDIKPANLLMAAKPDGGWQVRVTDFGSGRLMEPGRLDELGITRLGFTQTQAVSSDSLTGTPLYLAPELLAGQSPTQASDVYALGVLLYQLLVADFKKPLSAGWEREVREELLREDIALAAAGDAGLRLESARALAQRVMQLPQRRQERSAALRQAEEVEAARLSLARARQRRPWAIAAGLALTGGLGVSLWFSHQAGTERDRAEREAKAATAVVRLLSEGIIAKANPLMSGQYNLTVKDAVLGVSGDLAQWLPEQPQARAAVRRALAQALVDLSEPKSATAPYTEAVKEYDAALGERHPQSLDARLGLVNALSLATRFDEASAALAVASEALKAAPAGELVALRWQEAASRGMIAQRQLQWAEAAAILGEAVALEDRFAAEDPVRYEQLKVRRVSIRTAWLVSRGESEERAPIAVLMAKQVEDAARQLGNTHPIALMARSKELQNLDLMERYSEMEPKLALLEQYSAALPPANPMRIDALKARADIAESRKDYNRALAMLRQIANVTESQFGRDNFRTIVALNDVGGLESLSGDYARCASTMQDLLGRTERSLGKDSYVHHMMGQQLLECRLDLGDAKAAEALLGWLDEKLLAENQPQTEWTPRFAVHRGRLALLKGDRDSARQQLEAALQQFKTKEGPQTDRAKAALLRLGV